MPYDLYPAVDENYDFAQEVRIALAKSLELRNTVVPMTTVLRNNLTAAEKWDGRLIVNTDTDRIERYDATNLQWFEIAEASSLSTDYVLRNGGTMVADPTVALGVATKQYNDKFHAGSSGFRNVLRNGDFCVAQRGEGPYPSGGTYGIDGWIVYSSGGVATSPTRIPVSNLDGAAYAIQLTTTNATGLATEVSQFTTRIEDVRTLAGRTVTLSFMARATSGTPKLSVTNEQVFGAGGSTTPPRVNVGIVTLSTTWTRYSITFNIPSIVGKTIGANSFLGPCFWLTAGGNFPEAGGIGAQNNTFQITDIQLEEGTIATPFERLPIQQQRSWCQRYFFRFLCDITATVLGVGHCITATQANINLIYPVTMRATPTMSVRDANSDFGMMTNTNTRRQATNVGFGNPQGSGNLMRMEMTVASGLTAGDAAVAYSMVSGGYIDFGAELT